LLNRLRIQRFLTSQQLGASFEDFQTLIENAAPMVQLATSIASKVQKHLATSKSTELNDTDTLIQSYLVQLGIDSPITKDAAGSMFHLELSKEIGKVILPIILKPPYFGMIDLMDVFCLFSRARGVGNFVSPSDLVKSCELFDRAGVPLFIRRFPSGVTVLQSTSPNDYKIIDRIVSELESEVSGLDLASLSYRFGASISLEMLKIHLSEAESLGRICRDLSPPVGTLIYYAASPFFA